MKLYINIMPFSFCWGGSKPIFLPIGTTFAAVGADMQGIMLEQVSELNKNQEKEGVFSSINPEMLKIAFKEVDILTAKKDS